MIRPLPFRARFPLTLLALLGAAWLLSCFQSDPEKSTDLIFRLDSSLVGKFDSIRVEIFAKDTAKTPLWAKNFKLDSGQKEIRIQKPAQVTGEFSVVITGFKADAIVYKKVFDYVGNKLDTLKVPAELVRDFSLVDRTGKVGDTVQIFPAFVPPNAPDTQFTITTTDTAEAKVLGHKVVCRDTGKATLAVKGGSAQLARTMKLTIVPRFTHADSLRVDSVSGPIYDTLSPQVTWYPSTVSDSAYTLTSLDTTHVIALGSRLVPNALGTYQVVARSMADTAVADTFDVQVRAPAFNSEIKPITTQWCGTCHAPGITFNLQDSATLISKGSKALYRLMLQPSDSNYMPANKAVLYPRDKSMLLYWLRQNVKPVTAMDVADTAVALGDSIVPDIRFTPSDATDRSYSLVSSNTAKVAVVGGSLVAYDTGSTNIEATAGDGGFKKSFKVTVLLPAFDANIKPITTAKCGACHSPVRTFNLQDSLVLVQKGAEALRRVQLPVSSPDHMPADTSIKLAPRELKALLGWLNAYFVRLNSVTVDSLVLKVGETKAPVIHWNPANASNRNYHLNLAVTDTTKVASQNGLDLYGLDVGGPTTVIVETEESKFSKAFSVRVVPIPMDSIRGVDTGGAVGDTVLPRVRTSPSNVTDSTWVLRYLSPTPAIASIFPNNSIRGTAVGTAKIEVASKGTPAVKDTFDYAVGPVRVISVQSPDQTVTIGTLFYPTIYWNPPAATNKSYSLSVAAADTGKLRIYPPDVASATPRLEARGVGSVIVTLNALDTDYVIQFRVTVGNVLATAIQMTLPAVRIYVDSPAVTFSPTISWTPANTTLKNYTLTTGTPATVAVSNIVTPIVLHTFIPKTLGTGRVTATSVDGPKDSATFTIYRPPFSKVQGIIQARCFACHQGGATSNPRIVDSAVALGPSIYSPPALMKDEIVRRIRLSVATPGHMPADGTALRTADSLAIMVRYFSW